jgi:hypothetical protein
VPYTSPRLRLSLALLLALMQALLPFAAHARAAGRDGLVQEICSADSGPRAYVVIDGKLTPVQQSSDHGHLKHCALCGGGHAMLPGPQPASLPAQPAGAQLITVAASLYQPQALRLGPPPRGPPASL